MIPVRAPRPVSTQIYFLGLVAAVIIPLLAFTAFLLTRYAAAERARYEREAAQIAHQVALVLDGELERLLALLKGLAASSALNGGDLAQFYAEAKRLVDGRDEIVVLRDLGARQLVNTRRPFGLALPPAVPIAPQDRAAYEAGRPVVSRVYTSPLSGEPRIAVSLPIARRDSDPYVLALTVPTTRIRDVLLPAVPAGWIIGVGDRNGTYVTRSARHEEVSGKPGLPEYIAQAVGRSGTFASSNFEGVQLLAGYYRSELSDWLVGANIPQSVVEAPLWRSLAALAAIGAAALALSALLAWLLGRSFTAATARLAQRALALGQGRPVPPLVSRLREFALIGDALATAAAQIEERARERERSLERDALLGSIFDAAGLMVGIVELLDADYRFVVANRRTSALFDHAGNALEGLRASELGRTPQEIEIWLDLCRQAQSAGAPITVEHTFTRGGVARAWNLVTLSPLSPAPSGNARCAFTAIDITERKRGEQQRRLLVDELNHRVKNTLATVQSIAVQTLRGAASPSEARDALTGRLIALARAHDVLTEESWEGAELHDIVKGAVGAHDGGNRFVVTGPPLRLPPALSVSLSLVLHELATNATKYGALAAENGRVEIGWHVTDDGGEPRLALRWAEHDGPPVKPPAREGFGTRLIQRSFAAAGGTTSLTYAPHGLVCIIEAPIRPKSAPVEAASAG